MAFHKTNFDSLNNLNIEMARFDKIKTMYTLSQAMLEKSVAILLLNKAAILVKIFSHRWPHIN